MDIFIWKTWPWLKLEHGILLSGSKYYYPKNNLKKDLETERKMVKIWTKNLFL